MAKSIGIDLGTIYTKIAIWDDRRQQAVIIPNRHGMGITPSVIGLDEAGEVVVGMEAERSAFLRPAHTVQYIKRELGDDCRVTLGDRVYDPPTLTAFILKYLKASAEDYLGEPVRDAVIAIPAVSDVRHLAAFREAGRLAGLHVHRLVADTTAAAIALKLRFGGAEVCGPALLVDLGGGMVSVSAVDLADDCIAVVGTGGELRLGGLDMDEQMMKWALRQIRAKHSVNLAGDEAARRRLLAEAEIVKRQLAAAEAAELNVPFLTVIDGRPLSVKLSITRAQYQELIQPLLARLVTCLDEAMAGAERADAFGWSDLTAVYILGGPTRLPMVRQWLHDALSERCGGRVPSIRNDLNPEETVAHGAAIVAGGRVTIGAPQHQEPVGSAAEEGAPPLFGVVEVVTARHSVGFAVAEGKFKTLIPRGTTLPVTRCLPVLSGMTMFTTDLVVELFQGEEDYVAADTKIGELRIAELDPHACRFNPMEVAITLDVSGNISAVCTDLRTRKTYPCTFSTRI